MVVFSNEVCRNFTAMSLRTLLLDHVHFIIYSFTLLEHYIQNTHIGTVQFNTILSSINKGHFIWTYELFPSYVLQFNTFCFGDRIGPGFGFVSSKTNVTMYGYKNVQCIVLLQCNKDCRKGLFVQTFKWQPQSRIWFKSTILGSKCNEFKGMYGLDLAGSG